MSAFIVSHDHIDALLTFASQKHQFGAVSYYVKETGACVTITEENATEIGRILLTENERSVRHRYPSDKAGELPGTIGEDAAGYTFKAWPINSPLTAVSILKGCSCFDYQACEHDGYEDSLAFEIVNTIRKRAISRLPGYDNAPGWEFDRPVAGNARRVA